jgi:predicted nucleotidyltransferase
MAPALEIDPQPIADFCRRWKVTEFALFGSILRTDFRPDSDVDVLVSFEPGAPWTLWDLSRMRTELRESSSDARSTSSREKRSATPSVAGRSSPSTASSMPLDPLDRDPVHLWDMLWAAQGVVSSLRDQTLESYKQNEDLRLATERRTRRRAQGLQSPWRRRPVEEHGEGVA